MKLNLRQMLASWWAGEPDGWLLDFFESHGALTWLKRGIAAAAMGLAAVLFLAMYSPAGPHHPVARLVDGMLVVLAGAWAVWWMLRPWPTPAQSLWLIGVVDVAIALGCVLDSAPLTGLAATSVFLLPGVYLTFFHGAKAQVTHAAWVVLVIAGLAVAVGVTTPGPGGWALAGTQALVSLMVTVGILPTLLLGFWAVRRNAADSLVDPLTGLANRRGLDLRVNQLPARPRKGSMCAFAIDLDNFKSVNDRHGHPVGDHVLIQTAARIQAAMGPDALVARVGGEEFVAIDLLEPASVPTLAERIRHAIADATDPPVTASIGVAVTTAVDLPRGHQIGMALTCADTVMYEVKRRGGNGVDIHPCTDYAERIKMPGGHRASASRPAFRPRSVDSPLATSNGRPTANRDR